MSVSFTINASAEQILVPSWMKSISGWWSEGKISDEEYLNATQFLVNSRIIKIPLIADLQNQITKINLQLDQDQQEISQLKIQNANLQAELYKVTNGTSVPPSQPNPVTPPQTTSATDAKKISSDWYNGKITDQQFVEQIQELINDGKITPYTKPTTFLINVIKPIPSSQREVAESALKSQGIDTSGHPSGGVDVHFLMGFLQYLCDEGYASGSVCYMIPGPIHIQNTAIIDTLNNNATISTSKTVLQQWLDNKTKDQDLVNQFVALLNNGTYSNPAQDFNTVQTPTQPIPNILKDQAGFYTYGNISEDEWRNTLLAALYRMGYLHNP